MKKIKPYTGLIIAILFTIFCLLWERYHYQPTVVAYKTQQKALIQKIETLKDSIMHIQNLQDANLSLLKQKLEKLEQELQEYINQENWSTLDTLISSKLTKIVRAI